MKIPKNAKILDENKNFLVLKLKNHRYCVYDKAEERSIYETTNTTDCYNYSKKMSELNSVNCQENS